VEPIREPGRRLSPAAAAACSCLILPLLALGDVFTGAEASFTLLYAVPIAFATWFASLAWGVALSSAAALASIIADALARYFSVGGAAALANRSTAVIAWNVAVQLGTFLALVWLLDALRRQLERERADARTDILTGCSNRRAFLEAAALELERARRHRRPLTLAYVDLDGFKGVNDALGHAQGDALLVVVARTLRAGTRSFDLTARLGGDEFGLLLPETGAGDAAPLLARLRAQLEAAMRYHGWVTGFSIGVVTYTTPPGAVAEMIQRADTLMYAAKNAGKGTTRFEVVADGGAGAP
jgi:diguanylate cyclase (GGDEF)-like protein